MDVLTLNCWVRSKDAGRIFEVEISSTKTVATLKKAIKNENPVAFRDVDAATLRLYKPKVPVSSPHEENLAGFMLSEHGELLKNGVAKLSKVFPESLPEGDIHIIVDAPSQIICWLRGVTLDARFLVSIRLGEGIGQLLLRIKDTQSSLRDVDDQRIRLYKISGEESELQESLNTTGDGELLQEPALFPHFLSLPVLNPLCVVVEVSTIARSANPPPLWHQDLGGEDQVAAARKIFIDNRPRRRPPSDSSRPSSVRATQGEKNKFIPCGRPREPEEIIPVTLLHPVFGQFLDDCKTGAMTEGDNQFAGKLANVMSNLYEDEARRVTAVHDVFKEVLLDFNVRQIIPGTNYVMDASLSVADAELPPYFIAEFKNEASGSKSEPYMQAVAYYLEASKTYAARMSKSALPCFLLVAFGPYVVFAGAAWNVRPVVQVLSTPLAFHYHSTDTDNQLIVARHMAAFRGALRTLNEYYKDLSRGLVSEIQSRDILFPCHTKFKPLKDEDGHNYEQERDKGKLTIRYTKQLDEGGNRSKLVFFGTLEEDPTAQICIKFARRYSKKAHLHCATLGFAPKLRGFEALPGGWYMIIMDTLVGYDVLADLPDTKCLPRSVFETLRTQLETLHDRGMVHGDIRDANALVKKDRTKMVLVDFDWAGKECVVQYPPYVNRTDIRRPVDARDGLPIKAAHDLEMLDLITEAWATKDS